MKTDDLIRLAKRTALISFIAGTIIFALFYFTMGSFFLFTGYIFILVMGLINLVLLTCLLLRAFKEKAQRTRVVLTGLLMLLNLPVMLLYCWVAMLLMNTLRINFVNDTGTTLTELRISGCESASIKKLAPGESETVWIGIHGDCSVQLDYQAGQQNKTEMVDGYVTNNLGDKKTYHIGTGKSPGSTGY